MNKEFNLHSKEGITCDIVKQPLIKIARCFLYIRETAAILQC